MIIDYTVTDRNATQIADETNARFAAGELTIVNGYELKSRFGSPVARAWQNGTVSITVKGRGKGKINDVFFKVGASIQAGEFTADYCANCGLEMVDHTPEDLRVCTREHLANL
jgi:hypothetical protein